jgi:hypothetical protein
MLILSENRKATEAQSNQARGEQGMTGKSKEPATELHPQYSSEGVTPTTWADARSYLEEASVYWLATVLFTAKGAERWCTK